ncbi:MAG: 16S rRNA (guanine(527)-N(7))-methyltransferase RsmG [Defluviitaleaceae bacterium]|nr:16S rRNA (guanine(527)-N(7))-methyltransferase RsmG [Defluviitaleaceae bacterium]
MFKNIINSWASANGLVISQAQYDMLEAYKNRVLEVNKHMNLTAITSDEDFAVKHIIDSLTLLPFVPDGARCIDIGTGAGFPGVVLRIMKDIRLTLLDSLRKRIVFLREATDMLGLTDIDCVHSRAEQHKNTYQIATARAVASLDKLVGYALPLLEKDGVFLAMKGRDVGAEIEMAEGALRKYGGVVGSVERVGIAEGVERSVVVVRRI